MRIGVAATPDVAIPTLEWLKGSEHDLVCVISQPDRPSGRGQSLKGSAVSAWATSNNIELFKPLTIDELNSSISGLDLLITIGYGRILPKALLVVPRFGCINLHFSLLPKYRGAAPVQRAIENGETQSGVTVFQLDEGMDTGPIYSSISYQIPSTSRSSELFHDLSLLGVRAVKEALNQIEKNVEPIKQNGEPSYARKLSKEEGEINWSNSSESIINKIRAFYPSPTAWSTFRNLPIKISQAQKAELYPVLEPGQLYVNEGLCLIGAKDGNISLISVIPAGKKEMTALDWSRGARFRDGESCG